MPQRKQAFPEVVTEVDFCVVGGGMAGVAAALAAARRGARVALMHERPVLGGNASSECRVHIGGADRSGKIPNMRETGILEEVRLDNIYRNPQRSYSIWDLILYEKLKFEPNVTLLLNCSCTAAEMRGRRIRSVSGWQLTTQTWQRVRAKVFADCSGDGVLAPLTGAEFRMGREGRAEYGESIAPEQADNRTMGMTCLFQARRHETPQPFTPPSWAYRFDREEELPYGAGAHQKWFEMGYWWVELGGEQHSILDTEACRDELLRIVLGLWDHIKNRGDHGASRWALDWLQFLPAKRESRRYIGDHVLTQGDIEAEGRFDDRVAYGGWSMDDHHPAGFHAVKVGHPATIFHKAPSPYGIPYRALYSRNIENLMFAGRCASATHAAMSSTRVMGTCVSMGQAVGTAAALAVRKGIPPRGVGAHIVELQQMLLVDDCYIPWILQQFGPLTRQAALRASQGNPEPVRDGVNRPVGDDPHAWLCAPGDWLEFAFPSPQPVDALTLIVDSGLDKYIYLSHHGPYGEKAEIPRAMPRALHVDALVGDVWTPVGRVVENHQRLIRMPIGRAVGGLRLTIDATWGSPQTRVYAFYVD